MVWSEKARAAAAAARKRKGRLNKSKFLKGKSRKSTALFADAKKGEYIVTSPKGDYIRKSKSGKVPPVRARKRRK